MGQTGPGGLRNGLGRKWTYRTTHDGQDGTSSPRRDMSHPTIIRASRIIRNRPRAIITQNHRPGATTPSHLRVTAAMTNKSTQTIRSIPREYR